MDPGVRAPLVELFRRGEVGRDVRLLAARGAFAPRALDQLALLLILQDDADGDVADAARATLDAIPAPALAAFLAREDVPAEIRAFFAARGVAPAAAPSGSEEPLVAVEEEPAVPEAAREGESAGRVQALTTMTVMQKMKRAMNGTREERAVLVRDPNRLVAAAVLSSPKLTESEVESFARMANVSDEVLRVIGSNRNWLKNYGVAASLARNPKTPPGIALTLLGRLHERDVKTLATDRNVPEAVRIAARKRMVDAQRRR